MVFETYFLKFCSMQKKYLYLTLALLIIGLWCHGFMIFNKLPNHDDIFCLENVGTTWESGRWALPFLAWISGRFSCPTFNGIFSLVMLILTAFFICDILEIKDMVWQFLVGALFICFPSVVATMYYMFTLPAYSVAVFLAVLSLWIFVTRHKHILKLERFVDSECSFYKKLVKIFVWIGFVSILALSMGIYQSYFQMTCALSLVWVMKYFLAHSLKDTFSEFLKIFMYLFIGLCLYYCLAKLFCYFKLVTMNYQGVDQTVFKDYVYGIIGALEYMFVKFFALCFEDIHGWGISRSRIVCVVYAFSLISGYALFVWLSKIKQKNLLIATMLYFLLPVSVGVLKFAMPKVEFHALMVYSYFVVFVVPVVFFLQCEKEVLINWEKNAMRQAHRIFGVVLLILLSVCTHRFMLEANRHYTITNIALKQFDTYCTTLITQIKSFPGYKDSMQVCIILGQEHDCDKTLSNYAPFKGSLTGADLAPVNYFSMYSLKRYFSRYLGFSPKWYNGICFNENSEVYEKYSISKMPCYPDDGSFIIRDNIIFVKMGKF